MAPRDFFGNLLGRGPARAHARPDELASTRQLELQKFTGAAKLLLAGAQRRADEDGSAECTVAHLFGELVTRWDALFREAGVDVTTLFEAMARETARATKGSPAFLERALVDLIGRAEVAAATEAAQAGVDHIVHELFTLRPDIAKASAPLAASQFVLAPPAPGGGPASSVKPALSQSESLYIHEGRIRLREILSARCLIGDDAAHWGRLRRLLENIAHELGHSAPSLEVRSENPRQISIAHTGHTGRVTLEWHAESRTLVLSARSGRGLAALPTRYSWAWTEERRGWTRTDRGTDIFSDLAEALETHLLSER